METFYIINFGFKFVELLDTVFLVLKKKKLELCVFSHTSLKQRPLNAEFRLISCAARSL